MAALQQPIYPTEFNYALDRLYTRLVTYVDARVEAVAAQMRVDKQESITRDETLLKRIEGVEGTQKVIIDTLTTMAANFTQAIDGLRTEVRELTTEMREGFAAQAERHNELMVRVEKIERRLDPPKDGTSE